MANEATAARALSSEGCGTAATGVALARTRSLASERFRTLIHFLHFAKVGIVPLIQPIDDR